MARRKAKSSREEDEYGEDSRRRKVMTAVADSDEEDDEEDAEDGFIDDNVTELPMGKEGRMPRRPFIPIDQDEQDDFDDVEAMARRIQEKYGSSRQADHDQYEYEDEKPTSVEQQANLPSACKGLRYINPRKMMIVPIKEMVGVLSVKTKPIDISNGTWVRMKIGAYKGDLGQVTYVDNIRQRVTVKLVPRINLQELADKLAGLEVVKKAIIPPPRIINTDEVREHNIQVDQKHDPYTGEYFDKIAGMMFKDGFLYKSVSMKSISYRDIQPTFDELERFQWPGETGDRDFSSSLSSGDTKKAQFLKGDKVIVVKGDLKNMRGIIEKVEEECASIKPGIRCLPETLSVNIKDISKYFETGDHVKVISGFQEGATGMVIKVEGRVLVIVSDASMEEIRVFADSVMKSSEVASTANRMNEYQIHDLVLLNDSSFGLVIGVDGKAYHVLKGTPGRAETQVLKFQDITSKIEKMGTGEDKFRNRISVKDIVRIAEGPFKGGVMDSRVSHLRSSAYIPQSPGRPLIRGDERRYQSGRRGHDSIVGTMVKICKGHFKGSRGRVIEVKGQSVRIELESQMRTVTGKFLQLPVVLKMNL
ncbi:putative transcription elongation factor protein [Corchorus olitorius]|uniref:Transcription elongation factor protein n=1 Tax=Corchorus olitorius TaxID=93759 RepID=A0A1R3GDZ0_9ROSI|nr:putative transcription elongation factor protein [Corchorus olitorius]